MRNPLQRVFLGLGAVAVIGTAVLALDPAGALFPSPQEAAVAQGSATQAVVGALPATSNPTLGREALEGELPVPVPEPAPTEADWAEQRAALDEASWATTEATVATLSESGRWTEAEHEDVVAALTWRHEQMIATRQAMQSGEMGIADGRAALVSVANKARNAVIFAVGTERAEALDIALTDSELAAGL